MRFTFANRQKKLPLPPAKVWREFAGRALAAVRAWPGPHGSVLAELEEIGVVFVDDAAMAGLHERFSGVPGPTDILTFQHGEIVLGVETVAAQAGEYGHTPLRELQTCLVHGLLHLHGHEDLDPAERDAMHHAQDGIVADLLGPAGIA